MNRYTACVAAVLVLGGCKQEAAVPPAPTPVPSTEGIRAPTAVPEDEPTEPRAIPGQDPNADGTGAQDAAPPIDGEVMKRFLAYWEEELAGSGKALRELAELQQSGRADADTSQRALQISQETEARREALRQKHGLTREQVKTLRGAAAGIAGLKSMGTEARMAQMIEELRQELETLPPEQRDAARNEMKALEAQLQVHARHEDVRRRYGDAAVDAVMANEAKVLELYKKSLSPAQ